MLTESNVEITNLMVMDIYTYIIYNRLLMDYIID